MKRGLLVAGVALALALVTALVFQPAVDHEFLRFDDGDYVLENPHVAGGLTPANVRWALTAFHSSNWHPLTWMSHQLDCELFGLDPHGHHHTNVLLHAANAALCFLALVYATGRMAPSLLVAVLFALHPQRVQSVAWVSERKDLLAGAFFFLALLAYVRYARGPSKPRYLVALLAFALGLASKPSVVALPVVLLLLDVWPLDRYLPRGAPADGAHGRRPLRALVREKVPFALLVVASAALTVAAQRTTGALTSFATIAPLDRVTNAVAAYGTYLAQALAPTDLAYFYPHRAFVRPGASAFDGPLLAGAVALAVFGALAWRNRCRRPWILVGFAWYVLVLLPMIGIVQVGEQSHADRYTYLALLGPPIALAFTLPSTAGGARAALGLAAACAAVLVPATRAELDHWRDSETLFRRAIDVTERNYMAATGLGNVQRDRGEIDEARASYREALAARPTFPHALYGLGLVEHEAGNLARAEELYRAAVLAEPAFVPAHLNLGAVLGASGRMDEAIASFSRVLELAPDHPDARGNLQAIVARCEELLERSPRDGELLRLLEAARAGLRPGAAAKSGTREP